MCRSLLQTLLFACVALGTTVTAQTSPPTSSKAEWTLDNVLTAALAQHPLIEAARAQVTAAEGSRLTAGTVPNPVGTYWMENAREVSIYGTMPLEPFLQRGARIAQTSGAVRATEAAVVTAEQRVATDAVHAFYRVALAQAAVDAMGENRGAIEQLVEYLRNRVSQGATPEADLIRAEVERDRIETDVALADVELLRAQAALRPILGDSGASATVHVTVPDWGPGRTMLAPLAEFTAHALAQRPELLTSRANIEAAAGALDVERSLLVRQLGATFGLKRTAGVNAMIAGVSLTVPLFDRNRGEIQRATGERLAAEQQSRWLERAVAGEVEAEYQAAERLAGLVSALQSASLSRAQESRRIALAAYQEGATSLLQLLDASRALSDARLSYARAVAAANESLFNLGVAAGYDAKTAARLGRSAVSPNNSRPDGGHR